jgi:hypothetical protein
MNKSPQNESGRKGQGFLFREMAHSDAPFVLVFVVSLGAFLSSGLLTAATIL